MFIFESFLSRHNFLSFRQKKGNTGNAISKVFDRYAGIELAEACLSSDKRILAVRIHYLTNNAVEIVRKLQFECEAISEHQLYYSSDGIFSSIISSDWQTPLSRPF